MKSADANYFLSCDWGTSSLRLSLVDSSTGNVEETEKSSLGIKEVYRLWTEAEDKTDRERFYYLRLQDHIARLATKAEKDLDGIPVIVSGMASSSIGVKELPYSSLPLSLEDPHLSLDIRRDTEDFPHEVTLISGISSPHDVMRGEETQLLGLYGVHGPTDGLCILPGTHSKHIFIENKAVVDFSTFLTGELFDLLSTQSILKDSLQAESSTDIGAFHRGIKQAGQTNILNALFRIRAGDILHNSRPEKNYYFLSGLLIGTELADLKRHAPPRIFLIGESRLQQLYSEALDFMGFDHLALTDAERLAVEGQRYLVTKTRT